MNELEGKMVPHTSMFSFHKTRKLSVGMTLEDTDEFADEFSECSLQFTKLGSTNRNRQKTSKESEPAKSITEFMATHVSECQIPGYEATYDLLLDFEKNSAEYDQNRKFIEFVAALEFNDAISIWDSFKEYTNDVVLKQELERMLEARVQNTYFLKL